MAELIKINYESGYPAVSARDLHERLKIGTEFRKWFPRMTEYGFTDEDDFKRVSQKCPTLGGVQEVVDYNITVDMAKEICMIQRSVAGKQFREYFITIEKAWNTPGQIMARALKMADAKISELINQKNVLSTEVSRMKPKEIFADAVCASQTSILIGELAKILKQSGCEIGQNRLFSWLRENGYLIRRKGTDYNMPAQKSMDMGLFEIKETCITHSDGHTSVSKTPKVTGKGQQYFINKFIGEKKAG